MNTHRLRPWALSAPLGISASLLLTAASGAGCSPDNVNPQEDAGVPDGGGGACNSDVDCPSAGVCAFLESAGCAAVGRCFPPPTGARCAIASSPGCGCDGSEVAIGPSCATGLPDGYQTKRVLHAGPCADAASGPTWFTTCGDPVCRAATLDGGPLPDAGLRDDAGVPCPAVGTPCSQSGEACGTRDPYVHCGATEVCADHDPKTNAGGCPISSRRFKEDIEYLGPEPMQRLHDEALRIRLATYVYKPAYGDPSRKRLGFIIEDNPEIPAVEVGHDRVDIYGYVSMTLAAMQVQEQEIARLRQEVDDLHREQARSCPRSDTRR